MACATLLLGVACGHPTGGPEVNYLGETIRLAREYNDFDEMKNDPGNLPEPERAKVERLLLAATVDEEVSSVEQVIATVDRLVFPGYGSGVRPVQSRDGTEFSFMDVEVPGAEKDRCFLYRHDRRGLRLVDDFVYDTSGPLIAKIEVRDGGVKYVGHEGEVIRERMLPGPA